MELAWFRLGRVHLTNAVFVVFLLPLGNSRRFRRPTMVVSIVVVIERTQPANHTASADGVGRGVRETASSSVAGSPSVVASSASVVAKSPGSTSYSSATVRRMLYRLARRKAKQDGVDCRNSPLPIR